MPKILAILIACLLTHATFVDAGETSPDWALRTADGQAVRLSQEVRRQPVIVFFWATWCPYCKALMPHLHSIRLEYGDRIRILAVNFRDADGDPVGFVDERAYDFTVLPNGDDVAALYNVYGTPGVLIIDDERRVRFDLRALPGRDAPEEISAGSHSRKAAYAAPYWAAEIRKGIDRVLATETESSPPQHHQ